MNQKVLFWSFWSILGCYLAPGPIFGALRKISYCDANSLMGIDFHTKSQNKTIRGSLDTSSRSYS